MVPAIFVLTKEVSSSQRLNIIIYTKSVEKSIFGARQFVPYIEVSVYCVFNIECPFVGGSAVHSNNNYNIICQLVYAYVVAHYLSQL